MSEYLTTETVSFEYDQAGRISKQTTITTEGPDDQSPWAERSRARMPALLRDAPMSSVSKDPFTKAKVNQWFGEHEDRDVVVDIADFRVHRSGHRKSGLMYDDVPS